MKQYIFISVLFLGLACLLPPSSFIQAADATMPTQMIGYAWAPNFGWLNFGSSTSPYKVSVDSNGLFSGYGWSTNLGWFKFDPNLVGPDGGSGVRAVKITSGDNNGKYQIQGWFRACSSYSSFPICTGLEKTTTGTERGGWDGWIKMKDVVYNPINAAYEGYAWGSLVGGWVNFGASGETSVEYPCDSNVTTCGNGHDWSASCSGVLGSDGKTITWTASPSTVGYNYRWKEKSGTGTMTVSDFASASFQDNGLSTVAKQYNTGSWYRLIEVTKIGAGETRSAVCNSGNPVIVANSCSITVRYSPTNTTGYVTDGNITYENNVLEPVDCGDYQLESYLPDSNSDGSDDPTAITWAGCIPSSDKKTCSLTVDGPEIIDANFGSGGEIVISGGVGSGNRVNLSEVSGTPISYPAFSFPVAKVRLSAGAGNLSVTNWGNLDDVANSCPDTKGPKLCISSDSNNSIDLDSDCIDVGSSDVLPLTITNKNIQFYFPNKCANSDGRSVFNTNTANSNSGYWPITLTSGASNKTFILWFNDPVVSNKLR